MSRAPGLVAMLLLACGSAQAAPPERLPGVEELNIALGSVRWELERCTTGGRGWARVDTTFDGPTGHVKSFTIDGPAARHANEPCMERILRRVRVPPFRGRPIPAGINVLLGR